MFFILNFNNTVSILLYNIIILQLDPSLLYMGNVDFVQMEFDPDMVEKEGDPDQNNEDDLGQVNDSQVLPQLFFHLT